MLWICELELQDHTKGCVAQIMVLEPDLRDFGQGNQTSLCFWYPFQSEDDKSLYVLGFVSTIRIDNCLEWYLACSRFHVNVCYRKFCFCLHIPVTYTCPFGKGFSNEWVNASGAASMGSLCGQETPTLSLKALRMEKAFAKKKKVCLLGISNLFPHIFPGYKKLPFRPVILSPWLLKNDGIGAFLPSSLTFS